MVVGTTAAVVGTVPVENEGASADEQAPSIVPAVRITPTITALRLSANIVRPTTATSQNRRGLGSNRGQVAVVHKADREDLARCQGTAARSVAAGPIGAEACYLSE